MKEKLKKLLKLFAVCFMALISCFSIFACDLPFGGDDDTEQETEQDKETSGNEEGGNHSGDEGSGESGNPSGGTSDGDANQGGSGGTSGGEQGTPSGATQLTQAEAQAKYSEFVAKIASMSPNNGFTIEESSTESVTVDEFDYSRFDFQAFYEACVGEGTLSEEKIQQMKDYIAEMMEESSIANLSRTDSVVCSYDATNKAGYYKAMEGYGVTDFYTNVGNILYKKETSNYVDYEGEEYSEVVKGKYNVDENFYNQYLNFFNNGFSEMLDMMVCDTLEGLKQLLSYELTEDFGIELTNDNTAFGVTLEEKDGILELVVTLVVEEDLVSMDGVKMLDYIFDSKMTFKADATSIKEISNLTTISCINEINMSEILEEMSEGDEDGEDGEGAPSLIISIPMVSSYDTTISFSSVYDATKAPVFTESEYKGTGANEAVENHSPEAVVMLDNVGDVAYRLDVKMGESIERFTYTDPTTHYGYPINSITFYKDKACTQVFTETCPSYDIVLYVKHEDVQTAVEEWIANHPNEGDGGYNPGEGDHNPSEGEYNPGEGEPIDYTVTADEWASAIAEDNFQNIILSKSSSNGQYDSISYWEYDGTSLYMLSEGVNVYYTKIDDKYYMYVMNLDDNSWQRVEIDENLYNGLIGSILSDLTGFVYSDKYQFHEGYYEAEDVVVDDATYESVVLSFENKRLASVQYAVEGLTNESGNETTVMIYTSIYINSYDNVEIVLPTEFTEGSMGDLLG